MTDVETDLRLIETEKNDFIRGWNQGEYETFRLGAYELKTLEDVDEDEQFDVFENAFEGQLGDFEAYDVADGVIYLTVCSKVLEEAHNEHVEDSKKTAEYENSYYRYGRHTE